MSAAGILRAEWTKFSSIRATVVLLLSILAASAMLGWTFANASVGEYATATAQERLDFNPLLKGMRGLIIVQLLVSALGVLVATSEYGSGTMRASLAAVGRRGRLLSAKAVMTVLAALPVSAAAVWLMFVISQGTLAAGGAPHLTVGEPAALLMLLFGPVVLTLLSLFGLALGFLMRGTASAVNISTAVLLAPVLADVAPGFLSGLLDAYWPNAAALQLLYGASELPRAVAVGIPVGFVAVMVVAAFTRLRNSDA